MTKFIFYFLCLSIFSFSISYSQSDTLTNVEGLQNLESDKDKVERVYDLDIGTDLPIILVGAGWSGYAFTRIYNKNSTDPNIVEQLDMDDINSFDRWAADEYSERANRISDVPFYASMPLPILLLFDKNINSHAGQIGLLYLEAMSITGLLYTGAVFAHDRFRPLVYNPEAPMRERTKGGSKNSFFAGHPALVATSTFFMAKVYSDYHPGSNINWVLYGLASTATLGTAYLRHKAGKHFPSDLILGVSVGTLSGILVPHLHKKKLIKDENLSITPFTGNAHGLALRYKL